MYGHIVPQVYLKKWIVEGTKSHLNAYYKEQNEWRGKNIDATGGQSNYYILPLFDNNCIKDTNWFSRLDYRIELYQTVFPNFFEAVYDEILCQYEITLDTERIEKKNCDKLLKNFDSPELKIKQNGLLVKKGPIRERIIKIWKDKKFSDYLEERLGNIETNWENVVDEVVEKTNTIEHFIPQCKFNEIIQFISIQQARYREYSVVKKAIVQTENLVSDIMEGIINDKIDFSNEDNITIWMIQLLLYFTKTKDNIVDRLISSNSNSTVFIIKATEGNFITSDNPIIRYDCTPKGTLILYPISPKLCLCFGKGKEVKIPMVKQYNIMSANKTIVAFINNIVYQQARDYIISKSEDYIYSETAKPFMELLEMWKQIDYFSPM